MHETEFGAKLDMSIDEKVLARKVIFSSMRLEDIVSARGDIPKEYWQIRSTGRGKTERTAKNGIRLSGPELGRPEQMTSEEKKQSCTDNTDWSEVKREFNLAKQCYRLGL